jgi:hypothetical protein
MKGKEKLNIYTVIKPLETFQEEMKARGIEAEPYLKRFFSELKSFRVETDSDAVELIEVRQRVHDSELINYCLDRGITRPTNETPDYRKALRKVCRDGSLRRVKRQNWE